MASQANEFPVSLRSWPSTDGDPNKTLPSLIQRINSERGGFLGLDEDALRGEIAQAEAGADDGADESASTEEEDAKPDPMKDLMTARDEMLGHIEQAHQQTLFALDFVSLLISKDQPNQASLSISPFLRENVGMGTLGSDKITVSRVTDAQVEDNKRIAKGWKIQNLDKTADSLLASATRLEKEIEVETEYWKQVLAVSENGWTVCRLPNEKNTLGVRFGFSEAGPTFKNRSMAALRREPDGSVSLDQGISSSEPQYVRVRVQNNGDEVGCSTVPQGIADDAPIEARIQQARDTIFEAEIWHELNREARTLSSLGIRSKGDALFCPISPSRTIVIDLVPLANYSRPPPRIDDKIAEGIYLALHILLSFSHRHNFRRRTLPPGPLSTFKRPFQPYPLLRSLIGRSHHQLTLSSANSLLDSLCSILKSTSLSPCPSYALSEAPLPEKFTEPPPTDTTVYSLVDQQQAQVTLSLPASCILSMKIRTALYPLPISNFHLTLDSEDGVLPEKCRAPGTIDLWYKAHDYILFITSCALAHSFTLPVDIREKTGSEKSIAQAPRWECTTRPHIIRLVPAHQDVPQNGRSKQLSFDFASLPSPENKNSAAGLRLRVSWEWMGGVRGRPSTTLDPLDSAAGLEWKTVEGEGFYQWSILEGQSEVVGRGASGESGSWDQDAPIKSLAEVVEIAGRL